MRTKMNLVFLGLMTTVSFTASAAPPLQMHVYEEAAPALPATTVGEAVEPERLRVHVYEKKPKVSSHQGHRALAAVHHDEPLISYNGVDFYVGAGIRRDKLFDEKFHSNQLGAELTVHLPNTWFITSRAAYGEIESGRVIDGGDLFDASISFGKVLSTQSPFRGIDRIEWRPQLGYSYHEQNLEVYQKLASPETKWHGPWVGYGGRLVNETDFVLGMDLFFQYAFFDGDESSLINILEVDDVEIRNNLKGKGFGSSIYAGWQVSSNFTLKLDINYQYLKVKNAAVIEDFGEQLDFDAKWKSYAAEIGLEYQF